MRTGFFSAEQDEHLEDTNAVFWACLLDHIQIDYLDDAPQSVLDIGCHHGGLLARLAAVWKPQHLWGIEPMAAARQRASARLASLGRDVRVLDVAEWSRIPGDTIDLVTCHEVLYLVPDLHVFMADVRRVLSRSGRAYFVLGCHAENPVWSLWKPRLEAAGHQVYDHRPMDILAAGAALGLLPALRPLRQSGWITHDPLRCDFTFPSAGAMLDHHFKHKLLFRFTRS